MKYKMTTPTRYILALLTLILAACAHTEAPSTPSPAPSQTQNIPPYDRKEWGQWQDFDHDCQNTRQEILVKESLVPVTFARNTCTVKTGKWMDFYTGEFFFNAPEVEIDHVVPVKLAHDLGGFAWDKTRKREFYNDTDNLVITSKRNNAQKSANDITVWQPAKKDRACAQAKRWVKIKQRYHLPISPTETEYLKMLEPCPL
jgi:hypothetical protein